MQQGKCEQDDFSYTRNDNRMKRKSLGSSKRAENYNKRHTKVFSLKLQPAFLVISNCNSFRVLFDKIASVYIYLKNTSIF